MIRVIFEVVSSDVWLGEDGKGKWEGRGRERDIFLDEKI